MKSHPKPAPARLAVLHPLPRNRNRRFSGRYRSLQNREPKRRAIGVVCLTQSEQPEGIWLGMALLLLRRVENRPVAPDDATRWLPVYNSSRPVVPVSPSNLSRAARGMRMRRPILTCGISLRVTAS
jgi:hypothetical protein